MNFEKEITEYESLTETELQQFADAYNLEDVGKAQSPIVKELVQRVLNWEVKMKTEQKTEAKEAEVVAVAKSPEEEKQVEKSLELAHKNGNSMTLSETLTLGEVLYKSRFFNDIQSASQAVAKILAGRELGLGAMVSLSKVFVVGGKIAIQAEVMADMIKRGQKYDYRVIHITNEKCEIHFFENGKKIGESIFTMDDARKADLLKGHNWQKYPRNMLFSRALANGARWYCPDAIHGAYTYDEMGLEVDGTGMSLPKPEITIEAEFVLKTDKPKEKTRGEIMEELKNKYGVDRMKEIKSKLKIKEKLNEVSEKVWQEYIAELKKEIKK